jgi:hypothetical protein
MRAPSSLGISVVLRAMGNANGWQVLGSVCD